MSEKRKKRFGDRRDAYRVRDLDSMHVVTAILYPNRCDNEAFISERIDLTNMNAWLEQKNSRNPVYRYNLFQVVLTAALKTLTLRPKMNRYIQNRIMFQRETVTASFVVKKTFSDEGGEALAALEGEPQDTIDTIHDKIYRQISAGRSEKSNSTGDSLDMFASIPMWLTKLGIDITRRLDRYGRVPKSFIEEDPYYKSIVLSNLGSIGLRSVYHHLTNWGTNSVFIAIGEKKKRPFFDEEGGCEMRDSIDLGLTIDERLADGYYYSKTVKLLRTLLERPELLERPLAEKVEY